MDLKYVTDGKRHLVCVPYSLDNLHEMARRLDIKRCWFHRDHYDIPKRRIVEIETRCALLRQRDILSIVRGTVEIDEEALQAAIDAVDEVWQNWPKSIDSTNVEEVRRAATRASIEAYEKKVERE